MAKLLLSLFTLGSLLNAGFTQDRLEVNNSLMQARNLYDSIKGQSTVELYSDSSAIEALATEMINMDYSVRKVRTRYVHKEKKNYGQLECYKYVVLVSGENSHIRDAESKHLKKINQIIYGFLGTSYSMGASTYRGHKCEI